MKLNKIKISPQNVRQYFDECFFFVCVKKKKQIEIEKNN